jgi:hypothetical protein
MDAGGGRVESDDIVKDASAIITITSRTNESSRFKATIFFCVPKRSFEIWEGGFFDMLNRLIDQAFYLFGYNLPIDPKAQTGDLGIFFFDLFCCLIDPGLGEIPQASF